MVQQLTEQNQDLIVKQISDRDFPYSIAMFEFLGFLKHLKSEHFTTNDKLFKAIGTWFDIGERTVKGNIYVLDEYSTENRTRYTADKQKPTVKSDYEKLK